MSEILNETADPCIIVSPKDAPQVKLTATTLHFDKPNRNKRIYPSFLATIFLQHNEVAKHRGLVGMLGNPETSVIQLSMVSHLITDLCVKDNKLVVDIETLDTPTGRVLKKLLDNPESVAFRTMGIGSGKVNEEGIFVIDGSYKFITVNALDSKDAS